MNKHIFFTTLIILFLSSNFNVNGQNSPGNVSPKSLKAWFKADEYDIVTPNTWKNSVENNGLPQLTSTNVPATGKYWNYNPTISFNGSAGNNGFRSKVSNITDVFAPTQGTIIAIANNGETTEHGGVCGYRTSNGANEVSMLKELNWFWGNSNTEETKLPWNPVIGSILSIRTIQFLHDNGQVNWEANCNSLLNSTDQKSQTKTYLNVKGANFGIGEVPGSGNYYKGSIAEVIVFAKNISEEERNRAESYLAIKYSTTLGNPSNLKDYLASSGAKIWKADATFQNNIIGIGHDKLSELSQKQSHQRDDSLRIYLGDLAKTNLENVSTFLNNRSYIVMGSNEKQLYATDASNAEMYTGLNKINNCDLFSVIERKWKVQRTNMPDAFSIDIKLAKSAKLNLIDENDLRLIVNTDASLKNGWEGCYKTDLSKGFEISYNELEGMVTIKGISTTHIPDNMISYISLGSVNGGPPLPVGLSTFNSNCYRTNVELIWQTESETNNDYFTIEKSTDGKTFNSIATVRGQRNKTTASIYEYTDFSNFGGVKYYRLSQTDFDGKETILKTISSNCEGDLEVIIHPNPTNNGVYLTLNGASESNFNLAIYDLTGKMISQQQIEGSSYIELPNQKGIYLLKYKLNGAIMVEKIVKY